MTELKRVIVTGATGMIGRPLTAQLLQQGYEVVVFSRDPDAARRSVPGATAYVAWHAEEDGPWAAHLDGVFGVVHMAAPSLFSGKVSANAMAAAQQNRVVSTRGLVQAMRRAQVKPRVFVSGSAVGAYGMSGRGDDRITEESAVGTDSWALGNARWEQAAMDAETLGVRTVVLRTGVVFGYDNGALVAQLPQFERGFGSILVPGRHWLPWIHIADEVGIIMKCLDDKLVRGPVNSSAPTPATQAEFARTVGKVLNKPVWMRMPGSLLYVFMGEPARAILNNSRMIPQKMLDLGYSFRFPDLEGAVRDIVTHMQHTSP